MTAVESFQRDGPFFAVGNFCPSLNNVNLLICLVEQTHAHSLQLVTKQKDVYNGIAIVCTTVFIDLQLQVKVAVGVLHLQGGQLNHIYRAESRQCGKVEIVASRLQLAERCGLCSIVGHTQVLSIFGMKNHLCLWCFNRHMAFPCCHRHCKESQSY